MAFRKLKETLGSSYFCFHISTFSYFHIICNFFQQKKTTRGRLSAEGGNCMRNTNPD